MDIASINQDITPKGSVDRAEFLKSKTYVKAGVALLYPQSNFGIII